MVRAGFWYAVIAYLCWGIFPLYFKQLQGIEPWEVLCHRIVWALCFVLCLLVWQCRWRKLLQAIQQPRVLALFALSACLIAVNWLVYIWAVHAGRVVDASLGYFMTPLINVLLGLVLLRERLRSAQWYAVACAMVGVVWLAWQGGQFPWIALTLAVSFGSYGLLRKIAALETLEGLTLETLLLFPFALLYLLWLMHVDQSGFVQATPSLRLWLIAAGPITAIPLLLFAAGARRIPLATLGILQYIVPTSQMLIGVFIYHEPFGTTRLIGFAMIWLALLIYSIEGLWRQRSA